MASIESVNKATIDSTSIAEKINPSESKKSIDSTTLKIDSKNPNYAELEKLNKMSFSLTDSLSKLTSEYYSNIASFFSSHLRNKEVEKKISVVQPSVVSEVVKEIPKVEKEPDEKKPEIIIKKEKVVEVKKDDLISSIPDHFKEAVSKVCDSIKNTFDDVKSHVVQIADKVKEKICSIFN